MAEKIPTGNVFWIYFTLLSVISLSYLAFWSFHNENLRGLAIAIIFSILLIFTHILSRGEVLRLSGSFRKNAFFFLLGFTIWGGLVVLKKLNLSADNVTFSVLSAVTPQRNALFAEISNELPIFWQFFIDQISNPFIEEAFWLIGLPYAINWLLNIVSAESDRFAWMGSPIFKFLAIVAVAGITFPLFHVRGLILLFVVAAFIFRSIIITIYWGDELLDIFPHVNIIAAFAVGMHIANNWFDYGFFRGLNILSTEIFGWIVIITMAILLLAGLDYMIETPLNLLFAEDSF